MIAQIITENGQKKVIPLTADAGAGNPVGTIIPMYKKSSPSGYLYCDGSTFDETKYPLLYAYLGSNKLPDYREFALVGAEENTTDVYNASTNPNGTIHDHDVYTEGQAKDDQLQEHRHGNPYTSNPASTNFSKAAYTTTNTIIGTGESGGGVKEGGRVGDVTRGKRKAVYFYIKATSGLTEGQQDNVVAQLNEERSYSTEEVNTGKKWIDGKPIYRKVIDCGALPSNGQKTFQNVMSNTNRIISIQGSASNGSTTISLPYSVTNSYINIYCPTKTDLVVEDNSDFSSYYQTYITLEYTKTTD